MQFTAVLLLTLAASAQAASNMTATNATATMAARPSDRSLTAGLVVPANMTWATAKLRLHNEIESAVLPAAFQNDTDTIVERAAGRTQALEDGQALDVVISFQDTKKGVTMREARRRKCNLDVFVAELEKQIADKESKLQKGFPYLTGTQSTNGTIATVCEADDSLSGGAIASIAVGSLVFVAIIAAVVVLMAKAPEAEPETEPVDA